MIRDNLYSVEVNVGDKDTSFVQYHFYLCEETMAELKSQELKTIAFCRSALDDLFNIIQIVSDFKISEINKLIKPTINYGETYDKKHRFFEVMFTLGNTAVNAEAFKMFCFNLVLRSNDSIHDIDHGRFDFEFQALKEHRQYINVVEGFYSDEVGKEMNKHLNELSSPIKFFIERTLGQHVSNIKLSEFQLEEFAHLEGDSVAISSGMILGSAT